ncbi:MAG: hypothetical protein RSD35_01385 [Oscillospiraceae bacterium]
MSENKSYGTIGLISTLFLFAVVIIVCFYGFSAASHTVDSEAIASTEQTLRRAVIECYALEGIYPPSLEYIEKHYGVQIDREQYFVSYVSYGQNIMPDIVVETANPK